MSVTVDKVSYGGWSDCRRITNGNVELIVTAEVGTRIIRYGFVGSQNLLHEFKDELGKSGESKWMPRGGHRLWVAPETETYTYALDNSPVHIQPAKDGLTAMQGVEPETGLEKQMEIRLDPEGSGVRIRHRIRNTTLFAIEYSVWSPTMFAAGGTGIVGFPPRGTHPEMLAPTHPLVMWAYTDFSDQRWTFTKKYVILRQDPRAASPQKTGIINRHTWGAYLLGRELFLKQTTADPAKPYPDYNTSLQTFTNADFLELETMGPLTRVGPGETAEHIEWWSLHGDVDVISWSDSELDRVILPRLGLPEGNG